MSRFTDSDKLRLHLELDMLIAKVEGVQCDNPAALRVIGTEDGTSIRFALLLALGEAALQRITDAFPNPSVENY